MSIVATLCKPSVSLPEYTITVEETARCYRPDRRLRSWDNLGWQDENHRFMHPTTREIAKFMYCGMRKAPEGEVREMTGAIFANSVRSALKGKKPR
jgi:hypothetical protein